MNQPNATPPNGQAGAPEGLGHRLRQTRRRPGPTIKALAKRLSVSARTLYNWQCDETEPTVSQLREIAEAYGVDFLWLATGQGTPEGARDTVLDAAPQAASMDDVARPFGKRLGYLRHELGLSVEGFARRLGVSDQTVYRWQELHEPYEKAIQAVQAAFPHVRAAWLARDEAPVFSTPPPYATGAGVLPLDGGLEEQGRSVCLSLAGPDGRVLARVELVLLGPPQPAQVPLSFANPSPSPVSSAEPH